MPSLQPDKPYPQPFEVSVLPIGNLLSSNAATFRQKRRKCLGHFAVLTDDLIVLLMETIATVNSASDARTAVKSLCNFSEASTCAHAVSADDDLWRRLAFSLFTPREISVAPFAHSWRATVLRLLKSSSNASASSTTNASLPKQIQAAIFYSDVLFHKRRCRISDIDPAWVKHNDIPRVSGKRLSHSEFREKYEAPRRPVILKDVVPTWRAFQEWDPETLAKTLGDDLKFNAGGYSFTFDEYLKYSSALQDGDDQALYIFDSAFSDKAPILSEGYNVPDFFGEDMFSVLGETRPNFRWLIAGPKRSGSSFHIDPNATSAWNGAIRGRKKWLFFPPSVTPPGITPSNDGADVTAPLSVMEWFLNFYDRDFIMSVGALEAVVEPGEIMFVPRGWWHTVLNLDFSIAITQNFVSSVNVEAVARWIRDRPDQVSGCRSQADAAHLSANFASFVVKKYPNLHERLAFALEKGDYKDQDNQQTPEACSRVEGSKKRKISSSLWESLQTSSSSSEQGSKLIGGDVQDVSESSQKKFSFGF